MPTVPARNEEGLTAMHAPARHRADIDPWVERAACRDTDPETFFPPAGGTDEDRESIAKQWCAACPVARQCLDEALRNGESTGIWGGLNVRERRELLRVAATLGTISSELAAFLANGGRRIETHPRQRPAYVWFLRRRGWSPRRIAGALGLTFGQVQQAWHTAESASVYVRVPEERAADPAARGPRTRRPQALAAGHGGAS